MSPSSQIVCEDTRCNGERQTNKPSIEKNFSRTSINKILTVEYESMSFNVVICSSLSEELQRESLDLKFGG